MAQLAKSEADEREAKDSLESVQSEKEEKESGARDPENMERIRNLELINENNEAAKAAFNVELETRLNSLSEEQWNEYTNGSNRRAKWVATAMSHLATYYDQNFSATEFGVLLGVMENNHNVKLAIKKLIQLKIMKKFHDHQGSVVYGLVDTLHIHLRYEDEVDDSIQRDLDKLYREGNDIIKKRGLKRKRASKTRDDSKEYNEGRYESDEDGEDDNVTSGEV